MSMALEDLWRRRNSLHDTKHVIFTDSKSVLDSINNRNDHPTIRSIMFLTHRLRQLKIQVEFCWVPSHVGIRGNDRADLKAKEAAKQTSVFPTPIYYRDYFRAVIKSLNKKRANEWRQAPITNKLKQVKPDLQAKKLSSTD